MLAAAMFGSLLVGVLMLWLNYRAMSKTRSARLTLFVGFPVVILWLALLPTGSVAKAFALIAALQFYGFCNPIQGPEVYRHYAAGGRRASNWMVAAFVLMSAVLALMIQVVFGAATQNF